MADSGDGNLRRSGRVRKPTTSKDYFQKLPISGCVEDSSSSSEDEELLQIQQEFGTPSVLQDTDCVKGGKIFSFASRKTKQNLLQKVKEVQELYSQNISQDESKIRKGKPEVSSDDSESGQDPFSDSGSEYKGTESSSSSDEENSAESEHSDDDRSKKNVYASTKSKRTTRNMEIKKDVGLQNQKNKRYIMKTDDYFSNQGSNKIMTSDHTLDRLETPRLGQDQVQKLMQDVKLSNNHQQCLKQTLKQHKAMFTKWLFVLHENFNILLYGLGSKRKIIEEFCNEFLEDKPLIVINGFFPSLSIKDVLDSIMIDLLELKSNPSNLYECCSIIEQELGNMLDTHVYLIIHNIDGQMLRNKRAQNVLAHLANIENLHLIATIDHINGPLIWDHSKLCKFNYTWWDMTTYLQYIDETSFEGSMMVQKSGEFALSSLRNVFLSLTSNSKGIYSLIMKHQLENTKNHQYQGMAFKDLYSSCREAFLVSSDLALRAQLTEFVDHKMVKFKRSVDGVEYLVIPISNSLLGKFLDEQEV